MTNYFLPAGYRERSDPEYFLDENLDAVWQPDVYPSAASLAGRLGSTTIVDLGCGDGSKLAQLHPPFDVVGVDFGANIEHCRERYEFGTWIDRDFDSAERLPFATLDGCLLVCADVIEHLRYPERLLRAIKSALSEGADALVLSTPDRDLIAGPDALGPPENPHHVREWATDELRQFMGSEGLEGRFALTRTNSFHPHFRTILAVVPGAGAGRSEAVADWFHEYVRDQVRAHDRALDELVRERERFVAELDLQFRQLTEARRQLDGLHASGWVRLGARLRLLGGRPTK